MDPSSVSELTEPTPDARPGLVAALLEAAAGAAPHQLGALVREHAVEAGFVDVGLYLSDLQQVTLIALPDGRDEPRPDLPIDSTLAGRAFQLGLTQEQMGDATDELRLWFPMVTGIERLGVVTVVIPPALAADEAFLSLARSLAGLAGDLVVARDPYGDTFVALRRTRDMGVASEMQWGLLPPLAFGGVDVRLAGALEPAYAIAGDTLDYSIDPGVAHVAVFDAMGHGLESALMVSVAVNAYRKARRAGGDLAANLRSIEAALTSAFGNERFVTGVFGELLTDTGMFTWVNAGHHAPLLLRGGKLVRTLVGPPRWPLGLGIGEGQLVTATEQLEPGDRLLLFTDGVVEARTPDGEFYGVERLVDTVLRQLAGGLSGSETMRRVVHALLDHQQDRLQDDATLLLVEWRPAAS